MLRSDPGVSMRSVVDPITLEVVNAYLLNTVREMRATLSRSGWNVALVETLDFSCGLLNNRGELVSMSEDIPNHIFPVPYHARLILKTHGDDLRAGDVILTNDPYTGGPHLNDMVVMKPYFVEGRLTLLIAVRAHFADVGGKSAGSIAGQSREIYEEGIRIPPVKLVREGQLQSELLETVLANVRNPEDAYGDFLALLGTCQTAETRLNELFARYPHETVVQAIELVLDRAERLVRDAIAGLPEGEYFYEEYLESDGYTATPMRAQARLIISGDEMVFDFTGSAPQVSGPMNAGPGIAYTGVFVMVKSFLEPASPVNGGAMRPVKVIVEEGTFLNPRRPAPVAGFAEVDYVVEHVAIGLLGQVIPETVGATPEVGANHTYLTGWDSQANRHWIFYEYPRGGTAASPAVDGSNSVCQYDLGDIVCNVPVERAEGEYPLLVLSHRLRRDSGGPGYRRGGLGARREVKVLSPEGCRLSLLGEGAILPRMGMSGGLPGGMNVFTVLRDGREFVPGGVPSKAAAFPLQQGDVLVMQARGGCGWGDPLSREVERVAEDVSLGYVSEEQARAAYGVVLKSGRVDWPETQALRGRLRGARSYVTVVAAREDEYDTEGRRLCRLSPAMADRLGINDGSLIEYVPGGLGPHLKAWVRIDASQRGGGSQLGPWARGILRVSAGDKVWVRPLRPSV